MLFKFAVNNNWLIMVLIKQSIVNYISSKSELFLTSQEIQ